MIISDEHRFVFVHIPKCAGTSVRKSLEQYDSRKGAFTDRIAIHPNLGQLDYVHIPLFTLRQYFPLEFAAVQNYWSFAVMRDPFTRFASSISQRLKKYSDQPIQKRSLDEVRSIIHEIIDFLCRQPRSGHRLPPEYIHFQKQVDYIELEGVRILDSIYTVNEIDHLRSDIAQNAGKNPGGLVTEEAVSRANRTVVFRNELLRRVIEIARPVTDPLGLVLPTSVKQVIRDRVYVPRDQRMKGLFEDDDVRAFIRDYYAEDIALYRQISQSERMKTP